MAQQSAPVLAAPDWYTQLNTEKMCEIRKSKKEGSVDGMVIGIPNLPSIASHSSRLITSA